MNNKKTLFDIAIDAISLIVLVCFWIYILLNYQKLPEIIPIHFNGSGIADGFGEKRTIFITPILATVCFITLSILPHFPRMFHHPWTTTLENVHIQQEIAKRMLQVLKLVVIIIFFAIEYKTIQIAIEGTENIGRWFILMILALIFVPIFYFLIQFSKNSS